MVTGYCVYEKKPGREINNPIQIKLKNGRPAIKGTCASCGEPIFRLAELAGSIEEPSQSEQTSLFSNSAVAAEPQSGGVDAEAILSGSVMNPFPNRFPLGADEPIRLVAQCHLFLGGGFNEVTLAMTGLRLFLVSNADKRVLVEAPMESLNVEVDKNVLVGMNLHEVVKLFIGSTVYLFDVSQTSPTNLTAGDVASVILAAKKRRQEQTKLEESPQGNDFRWLKDLIDKGGVAVTAVKCPSCGGMVDIPKEGNFVKCEHCGQTLYVEDVLGIIKKLGTIR